MYVYMCTIRYIKNKKEKQKRCRFVYSKIQNFTRPLLQDIQIKTFKNKRSTCVLYCWEFAWIDARGKHICFLSFLFFFNLCFFSTLYDGLFKRRNSLKKKKTHTKREKRNWGKSEVILASSFILCFSFHIYISMKHSISLKISSEMTVLSV